MSIIAPKVKTQSLLLISVLLTVVYFFFFSEKPSSFNSFTGLEWSALEGCDRENVSRIDLTSRGISGIVGAGFLSCLSEPFELRDKVLRFNYLIKSRGGKSPFLIQIKDRSNVTLLESKLKEHVPHSQTWVPLHLNISPEFLGKNVRLLISEDWAGNEGDEFYLRDRVEFFDRAPEPYQLFGIPQFNNLLLKTAIVAVILTCLLVFIYLLPVNNNFIFWGITIWAIMLQFFSFKSYYYFDEWHVIQRFSEMGFAGVWHVHNEHFIPIFFTWYFAITKIFGENYTALHFISLLLHTLHAVVLSRVLISCSVSVRVSRVLSLLFSLSALHTEVLEWAFEQCIIICSILGLTAFYFALQYLRESRKIALAYATVICCILPLVFGNGFVWGPLVLALSFAFLIFRMNITKKLLSRFFVLSSSVSLALLIPLFLYLWNKPDAPVEAPSAGAVQIMLENIDSIINYVIVGSGLGSGLRAFGLYPNLTLSPAHEGLQLLAPDFLAFMVNNLVWKNTSIEVFLGTIGLIFLGILGLPFVKRKNPGECFFHIKVGFIILLMSFLLPAIGRWNLGELQSLALRYQYQALLGTVFLLVPLFSWIDQKLMSGSRDGARKILLNIFLTSILFSWLGIQSFLVNNFSYFRHHGEIHRSYTDELIDWDSRAAVLVGGQAYEGTDELKGLFPVHLPSITPGTHPTFILKTKKEYLAEESIF